MKCVKSNDFMKKRTGRTLKAVKRVEFVRKEDDS